jgi:hypothetical protein
MAQTPEDRANLQKLRQIESARATADYRAAEEAERSKTARLRAERIAREAATPKVKPTSKAKRKS